MERKYVDDVEDDEEGGKTRLGEATNDDDKGAQQPPYYGNFFVSINPATRASPIITHSQLQQICLY